jgi:nucleotide-binding universal stress UspA family protein
MFRNVLVATDLTSVSRAALQHADRLARDERAHLHILHVVEDPATQPWVVDTYGVDYERLRAEACGRGRRALIAATQRLPPATRRMTTEARVGVPADEILRYAKRQAIDLIVLGTHGRGRVASAFLGSVAERVLRHASCPVMIVSPGSTRRRATAA